MRALVTGASGFVGSHVIDRLVRRGDQVVAFDLPAAASAVPHGRHVGFVAGSFDDSEALARAAAHADVVIHAGGLLPQSPPRALHHVNVEGTRNVLQAAVRAETRRIVYLSSAAVYADQPPAGWPIGERHPLGPPPPAEYGQSKIDAERLVADAAATHGLEPVVLRPPITYGRGAPFAPLLVRALLIRPPDALPTAFGGASLQWVHVHDLAGAIAAAATLPGGAGETLNVAGGELFGFRRLAALLRSTLAGFPARDGVRGEPLRFDNARAGAVLGYHPAIPLASGFPDMVAGLGPRSLAR